MINAPQVVVVTMQYSKTKFQLHTAQTAFGTKYLRFEESAHMNKCRAVHLYACTTTTNITTTLLCMNHNTSEHICKYTHLVEVDRRSRYARVPMGGLLTWLALHLAEAIHHLLL